MTQASGFNQKLFELFVSFNYKYYICQTKIYRLLTNMLFADKLKELSVGKQLLHRQLAFCIGEESPMYSCFDGKARISERDKSSVLTKFLGANK